MHSRSGEIFWGRTSHSSYHPTHAGRISAVVQNPRLYSLSSPRKPKKPQGLKNCGGNPTSLVADKGNPSVKMSLTTT